MHSQRPVLQTPPSRPAGRSLAEAARRFAIPPAGFLGAGGRIRPGRDSQREPWGLARSEKNKGLPCWCRLPSVILAMAIIREGSTVASDRPVPPCFWRGWFSLALGMGGRPLW